MKMKNGTFVSMPEAAATPRQMEYFKDVKWPVFKRKKTLSDNRASKGNQRSRSAKR